ncbi:hypothetical protein D3C79_778250 [compost metagenome]
MSIYPTVETIEALVKEKEIIEHNLKFIKPDSMIHVQPTDGGNSYLTLPVDEAEEMLQLIVGKRRNRLVEINNQITKINAHLKDLHLAKELLT